MSHKNKAKGNMYTFIDFTFNPIRGRCPHNCSYCYCRRFWNMEGFDKTLRIIEDSFTTKFSEGERIFVGSSIDIFAEEIPAEWIRRVLDFCSKAPKTAFLFQTKNPGRFKHFKIEKNFMIAATIETNIYSRKIMGEAPAPALRAVAMEDLEAKTKMISIEPIMKFDEDIMMAWIMEIMPIIVSVGADSKGHGLPEPTPDELRAFLTRLEKTGIEIVRKDNLTRILKKGK